MVGPIPKLPAIAWANVILWTLAITLGTLVISAFIATGIMLVFTGNLEITGILLALILPLLLAVPVAGFFMTRHFQMLEDNRVLQRLAYTDSLLDCMNRRGFTASVDIALQYATPHRPCALLIIDIDNFKRVNDRFGHDQGDIALGIVADAIQSAIRAGDMLGRIGGEEFGAFLPGGDDAQARQIAERIRQAVAAAHFAPDGARHDLSVSIGGIVATEPSAFAMLYRAADQRLYAAKQDGRNRARLDHVKDDKRPLPPALTGTTG